MLATNLKHIETGGDHRKAISENRNVVIICGRMNDECKTVYGILEELEPFFRHVSFFDMDFDNPDSQVIRSIPEVQRFDSIPFMIYYKNSDIARATCSDIGRDKIVSILEEEYSSTVYKDSSSWWW